MRKTGVTILLLLYIFTQLGTIACYHYKPLLHAICYDLLRFRSTGKKEGTKYVIKTDLASFTKAKQDDREILWKGCLYDIKNIEINGDKITLTAEKDLTETRWMDIFNAVRQQITGNKSSHTPADIRFCQWIFKLYVPAEVSVSPVRVLPFALHNSSCSFHYFFIYFPDGPFRPPDFTG
jgi:hypothetical protein